MKLYTDWRLNLLAATPFGRDDGDAADGFLRNMSFDLEAVMARQPQFRDDFRSQSAVALCETTMPTGSGTQVPIGIGTRSIQIAGLAAMVKRHRIKNAVILAGAGPVRHYRLDSDSNRTFPSKNTDVTVPADILSMNGYIVDGKIHAQMTLANSEKAFGAHLEPGTDVWTFAIVTVGVLGDGVDLSRVDDKTYW